MPSRRMSVLVCVAALMSSSFSLAVLDARAQSPGLCPGDPEQIIASPDGWELIAAPAFPTGRQDISAYAVDPYGPDSLFVTNGAVVMRSVDAGCSFEEVFDLSSSGGPLASQSSISSLEIPAAPSAHDRIYALVRGPQDVGPQVFASRDSGATWASSSAGLLPVGSPIELVAAESSPDTLYLLVNISSSQSLVYRSTDGGTSWEPSSDATTTVTEALKRPPRAFSDLAVDPLQPDVLWAAAESGLYRSDDQAQTWEAVEGVTSAVGIVDVSHAPGRQSRVLAFSSTAPELHWSEDGGRSWTTSETPEPEVVESAAHSSSNLAISLASSSAKVFRHRPAGTWEPMTWPNLFRPGFRDLSSDRASAPSFYAHTSSALWRHSALIPPPPPPPPPPPFASPPELECDETASKLSTPPVAHRTPALIPANTKVLLSPGGSEVIRYELHLPPRPTLDTYVLVDTTGSMGHAICGVRMGLQDIVQALVDERIDIFMGLGDFRDYPGGYPGGAQDYPYRRIRKIGVPNDGLMAALNELEAEGGGDGPESHLAALYQAATGAGQRIAGAVGLPGGDIPAGQEAGFRATALPVILIVSDAPWHQEEPGYPGPSWEEAANALNDEGIMVVGVSIGRGSADDMRRMALDTDAIATEDVDCDDDGDADLTAGDPLVCTLKSGTEIELMGPAITGLLGSLEDLASVRLMEDNASGWIDSIDPPVHENVDLEDSNLLPYDVTFACPPRKAGTLSAVDLVARIRGQVVSQATALVVCSSLSGPPRQALAPVVPPPPPPPPLSQPVTAPGPVQAPAPAPAPAPANAPANAANAQAAAVAQRQEQPQMAFVHAAQQVKEQLNAQNAMVRAVQQRSDPLAAAKFGLAMSALSMILLYGLGSVAVRRASARSE